MPISSVGAEHVDLIESADADPPPAGTTRILRVGGQLYMRVGSAARAALGGGFGSDTIVDLANGSATLVQALELLTTLTNSVAGSEQSKFLARLLSTANGGAAIDAWALEPNKMTIDSGANTSYTFSLKQAGVQVATIAYNSNGQILITGGGGNGAIILTDAGGTAVQTLFTLYGTRFGTSIQEKQFANTASANDLAINPGGGNAGNVGHITGTTQINRIDTANWQNGSYLHLIFDGILTLTHNGAAISGTLVPLFLQAGTNKTTAVGDRITFRLLGANSGSAAVAWYQWTTILSGTVP